MEGREGGRGRERRDRKGGGMPVKESKIIFG